MLIPIYTYTRKCIKVHIKIPRCCW